MVMDWGVAKTLADDCEPANPAGLVDGGTHPGVVVGTRGFMPPEQARGEAGAVDRRADIYSLGAILFLLLTGDPPAADADPSRVVWRQRGVPKALRAICARALSADPADRYDRVSDVADDVARFRAGHAVLAYEENAVERLARLARTYRVAILLILGYIVMRVAVAFLAGW
jgi:serine/threonine-protein kinase